MQESLGVNRLDHETNNSSLCNNDVRNEWSSSYVHSSRVKGNIRLTIREKKPKINTITIEQFQSTIFSNSALHILLREKAHYKQIPQELQYNRTK